MKKAIHSCRKMFMSFLAVMALLLSGVQAFAQGPISGKVVDANAEPGLLIPVPV